MAGQANISPQMATFLKIAARCRLNILISGGTGSGKTTLLNALSRLINSAERTVTIEDAAELQLQQPHVVRLETRPPNLEGTGEITMRDLLRNALRMRPDRIILGEIRGADALDVLQAMNTGHDGSMSTIHANSPREALTQLENMVGMTGINLPSKAVRTQIAAAVHLIAQVNRMRDGIRRVTHVMEVVGMEGETITTQELFSFQFQAHRQKRTPAVVHHGRVIFGAVACVHIGVDLLDVGVTSLRAHNRPRPSGALDQVTPARRHASGSVGSSETCPSWHCRSSRCNPRHWSPEHWPWLPGQPGSLRQ